MIAVSDLSMRYGEKILFEKVSVKFRPGHRYGLIGANGSGKSTLMKIMCGLEESSTGEIAVDRGCTLGYLRQDHYEFEKYTVLDTVYMGKPALWKLHSEREELYSKADLTDAENERIGEVEELFGEAGGYTMETDAAKLLVGLGVDESRHNHPMSQLTGGLKLRVLLAQVLFGHPDILLLDEPTNHLDIASIKWLEDFLTVYEGTVIVISHDRHFINSICTHIADLDYQEVRIFPGNYDDFMTANAMALEKTRRENATKEKRINELKDFINRFSANASKSKQATSRYKELEKIQLDALKPSSRVSPYIRFFSKTRLGDKVIDVENASKAYDHPIFNNISLTIGNREKIAIIGNNGAGKTTLLRTLIKSIEPDSGAVLHGETIDIGYFPQEAKLMLNTDEKAVDWLARNARMDTGTETEYRAALGKMLFRGEAALKPVQVLSGGEKARLILAALTLAGHNVLALDEPTNHLDLESIESLNYALSLIEETVIFVSHDREFVGSLATRIIEIEDGRITDYPGKYDEYLDYKARERKNRKA